MRTTILCLILTLMMLSCKKENPNDFQELEIKTISITEVTPYSAISGGEMSNTSGKTITNKGVCWSTKNNPTLEDSSQWSGTNPDNFVTTLKDLEENTNYYVRAYVKYESTEETSTPKIVYGNELSFTTRDMIADSNIFEYISVIGGTFLMGSNDIESDEMPVHSVTVDGFKISKHEITNAQYAIFLNDICCPSNGTYNDKIYGKVIYADVDVPTYQIKYDHSLDMFVPKDGLDDYPAIHVNWYGANAFSKWAGGGRLPTEVEWEFAARGGNNSNNTIYAGSNMVNDVAWHFDNSGEGGNSNISFGKGTMEIGRKSANELDIYDMSGNVWEWCCDWYAEDYYENSPQLNPEGPENGFYKVVRGGSWRWDSVYIRVANRGHNSPDGRDSEWFKDVGFRPVLVE